MQQFDLAAFQAAHVQYIIDEAFKLFACGDQFFERFAHDLGVVGMFAGDVCHAQDAVKRRADIMADAGQKVAFSTAGGFSGVALFDQIKFAVLAGVAVADGQQPYFLAVRQRLVALAQAEPPFLAPLGGQRQDFFAGKTAERFHILQGAILGGQAVGKQHGGAPLELLHIRITQGVEGQLTDKSDGQAGRIAAAYHTDAVVLRQQKLYLMLYLCHEFLIPFTAEN